MTTEHEDHNQGQQDGADAGFMDTLAMEWNPLLSKAYKQGFRHALGQQSKKKAEEEPRREREAPKVPGTGTAPASDEEAEMPWVLKLLLAFYLLVFTSIFLLLRWIIQRPWRVAVALVIAGTIAFISWQGQRQQETQGETPALASQPETSITPPAAETAAPPAAPVASTAQMATPASGFAFLGGFSDEDEKNASFDPEAEPRPPYRVELWEDEETGIVGHVYYPVLEADSPVARVQNATFDEASGKISFQARIWSGNSFPEDQPQYQIHGFTGVLEGGTLRGTFSRQDEDKRYAAVEEDVTLKQVSSGPDGITTLAQWEAELSSLVMSRWE